MYLEIAYRFLGNMFLKHKRIFPILFLTFCMMMSCVKKSESSNSSEMNVPQEDTITLSDTTSMYLLVGTYTQAESEGIYVYQFDTISGDSKYLNKCKIDNPSFLALSKNEKYVYAVSETSDGTAAANALAFDKKTGKLTLLNSRPTGGADPCYIAVDGEGRHVVTANYTGGSVTLFDVETDGKLGAASSVINFTGKGTDKQRQNSPHIHCTLFSPDEKFLFATDLGTDKIHRLDVNKDVPGQYLRISTPPSVGVPPGSGPRHMTFHPNGKFVYLINELSGKVIAFNYDKGNLSGIQTIEADSLHAKGSADIHVSPDGRFLYVSNRLEGDGIAIFAIGTTDGKLTKVGYQNTGSHPRNFAITPNGKFLLVACRDANKIQIFAINTQRGTLTDTGKNISLSMPVCLKFASM